MKIQPSGWLLVLTAVVATASARSPVLPGVPSTFLTNVLELRGGAPKKAPPPPPKKAGKKVQEKKVEITLPAHNSKQSGASAAAQKKGKPITITVSKGGSATMSSEVFNLVKALLGVGALALPAGVAAFGDSPSAVAPGIALVAIMGVLSGAGFATIGRVCSYTGATSYKDAWSKTVGEGTSWIPAWSTTLKTSLACLAYSMVLADTFCSLLGSKQRSKVLVTLTVGLLLPLCWMKNLSSLAPFSLLGVAGMAYTSVAMLLRYLDGSYSTEGSALLESVAENLRPSFGDAGWKSVLQPSSLILVCMLSTAYMAHFNAPKFYNELQNNTLPRFNRVVGISFGISIFIMSSITALGFLTFGSSCSGLVLNNYSTKDVLMSASRVAVAISLMFSYPLAFQGFRDGTLDLLNVPAAKRNDMTLNLTTIVLLTAITFMAATLKDVSFVLAFGGATLGNALTYVYPALMYWSAVRKFNLKGETVRLVISNVAAVLGIVMGTMGAKMALEK